MNPKTNLKLYAAALGGAAALLAAHLFGVYGGGYDWFDGVPFFDYIGGGYDIFMHLLGGAMLGLFFAAFLSSFGMKVTAWRVVGLVMAVGLAWEAFEAIYDLAGSPFGTAPYFRDTCKDLFDDFIGSYIASRIIIKHL